MRHLKYQHNNLRPSFAELMPRQTHLRDVRPRVWILTFCFLVATAILSLRLFHLQVVQGAMLRERSDNNRIFVRRIPAARGLLYDRNDKSLVVNQPVYRLLTNDYGRLLHESPIITHEQALQIEATDSGRTIQSIGRYYPYGRVTSHVLGYVAQADPSELIPGQIAIGEMVGKAGLEKYFNQALIGVPGSELIELDARGRVLRRVGERDSQPGDDVYLHLDVGLQKYIDEILADYIGSVVVTRPNTGAVLALVSHPNYDPNVFGYDPTLMGQQVNLERNRQIAQLLSRADRPMFNRAIAGTYPPGSVYKIVPSVAGLETGKIVPSTQIEDTGEIVIDQFRFRNWFFTQYGRSDGMVDLTTALKRSNDIYYYRLGEMVGVDQIAAWSRNFGLGTKTGIDLIGEANGLVPDRLWKERVKNERWYLGNTYHLSIGQGDLTTTPLQVNQMMAVIASGGRWCRPLLVRRIGSNDAPGAECREVGIKPEYIQAVTEGLIAACKPGGTASVFFNFSLHQLNNRFAPEAQVACKTGTAQFHDPQDRTHAWFTIYAPVENPEIMITVMLEAAGEGSSQAAPMAKKIIEYWFADGLTGQSATELREN